MDATTNQIAGERLEEDVTAAEDAESLTADPHRPRCSPEGVVPRASDTDREAWDSMPSGTRARLAAWREVEGDISGFDPEGYALMINIWPDLGEERRVLYWCEHCRVTEECEPPAGQDGWDCSQCGDDMSRYEWTAAPYVGSGSLLT